jgi:hypothetical protein
MSSCREDVCGSTAGSASHSGSASSGKAVPLSVMKWELSVFSEWAHQRPEAG